MALKHATTLALGAFLLLLAPIAQATTGRQAISCVDKESRTATYFIDFDASTVNGQPAEIRDDTISWIVLFVGAMGGFQLNRYSMQMEFSMASWENLPFEKNEVLARASSAQSPEERAAFVKDVLPILWPVAKAEDAKYDVPPQLYHCNAVQRGI